MCESIPTLTPTGEAVGTASAASPEWAVHHWAIETPDGEMSEGRCKLCGATRTFRNYNNDPTPVISRMGRPRKEWKQCLGPCSEILPNNPQFFGRLQPTRPTLRTRCHNCWPAYRREKRRGRSAKEVAA